MSDEHDGAEIPHYHDAVHRAALRDACRTQRLSNNLSQENQADEIMEFLNGRAAQFSLKRIVISQQDMSFFETDNPKQRKSSAFTDILWTWMYVRYPDIVIQSVIRMGVSTRDPRDIGSISSPMINCGHDASAAIHNIYGNYAVYRRDFGNTSRIMVSELICGKGDDAGLFSMTMRHSWRSSQPRNDIVTGCIIPYGEHFLFQGGMKGWNGPFMMLIRSGNNGSSEVVYGEGLSVAGAGAYLPSAYATLITRIHSAVNIGVFEESEIQEDEDLWQVLRPVLNRGFVKWN